MCCASLLPVIPYLKTRKLCHSLPEDTDVVGLNARLPKVILRNNEIAQLDLSHAETR